MTKADIADMRHWHREAVRRSLQAEYDIVYVYAGHAIGGLHHFLSRRYNNRTDEYGGSSRTGPGCCARSSRTPAKSRRQSRGGLPHHGRRTARRRGHHPRRDRGRDRHARRAPRPVGLRRWAAGRTTRSRHASDPRPTGTLRRGLEGADHQTRRGRRPFHLTGHDGAPGQDRHARPDRRRPPLHRRPVPAQQDRDRQSRGHPRVHRLQHLRVR